MHADAYPILPGAAVTSLAGVSTLAELHDHLGGIPLERIRMVPPVGTAKEADLLHVLDSENRACELIDGVLVEKTMGYFESRLAIALAFYLEAFVLERQLGIVLGPDGTLRILADQIRAPDVAYLSWDRFPGRKLPAEPVPAVVPNLAVEVLSAGNTKPEIDRKLDDYFRAGVELVWLIDSTAKTAIVYVERHDSSLLTLQDSLNGGSVLPGFELSLQQLFDRAAGGLAGK